MKKPLRIACILALLLLAIIGRSSSQTAYLTDNGKKYHAKNCSLAKTGKSGMQLADAKKKGFEPCKNCKADAIKPKEKKPAVTREKK
jgi:NOL1/NOP2/fmu family ribosome biogenesis protein